jgi:hypothetical protein
MLQYQCVIYETVCKKVTYILKGGLHEREKRKDRASQVLSLFRAFSGSQGSGENGLSQLRRRVVHLLGGSVGQDQKAGLGKLGEARSTGDAAEEEVATKWLSNAR